MPKIHENDFSNAYNKYNAQIFRHIFFRVNDSDLAEDLMQETFFKTWAYLLKKQNNINEIKSFIYMVANNLIIDHYRQKDKTPLPLDRVREIDIQIRPKQIEEIDRKIKMNLVKKNLDLLKKKYKRVIRYRYIDNLTIDEICELTGKSPNHISVIIYQGTKELREMILNT